MRNLCSYEAVFYGALALTLMAWILFENALLYIRKANVSRTSTKTVEDDIILEHDDRCLELSDMKIPLIFVSHFYFHFYSLSTVMKNVAAVIIQINNHVSN